MEGVDSSPPPGKRRYDITMSKRTRKQQPLILDDGEELNGKAVPAGNCSLKLQGNNVISLQEDEGGLDQGEKISIARDHNQDEEDKSEDHHRKSLKQLIINGNEDNNGGDTRNKLTAPTLTECDNKKSGSSKRGGRSSLGQHFTEEEEKEEEEEEEEEEKETVKNKEDDQQQLQLVVRKQRKQAVAGGGIKLRGMVGRYVKVLSHLLIKPAVKHDKPAAAIALYTTTGSTSATTPKTKTPFLLPSENH